MTRLPLEKQLNNLRPSDTHTSDTSATGNNPNDHKTVEQMASDSITGSDEPMEREHPESPALLVFATYPVLLVLVMLVGLAVLWWWNKV